MLLFWPSSPSGCQIKFAAQSQLAVSLTGHDVAYIWQYTDGFLTVTVTRPLTYAACL